MSTPGEDPGLKLCYLESLHSFGPGLTHQGCVWLLVCPVVSCHMSLWLLTSDLRSKCSRLLAQWPSPWDGSQRHRHPVLVVPLPSMDIFLTKGKAVGCSAVPHRPLCCFLIRNHLQAWHTGHSSLAPDGATWPPRRTGTHTEREELRSGGWVAASSHGREWVHPTQITQEASGTCSVWSKLRLTVSQGSAEVGVGTEDWPRSAVLTD